MKQGQTAHTVAKRAHLLRDRAVARLVGCPEIGRSESDSVEERRGSEQNEKGAATQSLRRIAIRKQPGLESARPAGRCGIFSRFLHAAFDGTLLVEEVQDVRDRWRG